MGLFCASIITKGTDTDALLPFLRQRKRFAWVSRTQDGVSVVFDNAFDGHGDVVSRRFLAHHLPDRYPRGETAWEPLARDLSAEFACVVFAMEVYDGDYFYYELFDTGHLIDEYISKPNPFDNGEYWDGPIPDSELLARSVEEHAAILCRAFGNEAVLPDVAQILADSGDESLTYFADAIVQFRVLIDKLGLPAVVRMGGAIDLTRETVVTSYPDFAATRWRENGPS